MLCAFVSFPLQTEQKREHESQIADLKGNFESQIAGLKSDFESQLIQSVLKERLEAVRRLKADMTIGTLDNYRSSKQSDEWERVDGDSETTIDDNDYYETVGEIENLPKYFDIADSDDEAEYSDDILDTLLAQLSDDIGGSSERSGRRAWDNGHNS